MRSFKIRWTVIGDTLGVSPRSTAFSASRRTVQRRRPGGASEQASATRRASNAASKVTARGLRRRAASSASSTKRRLRCSIVRAETPRASAVAATVQAGPRGPWSHSSRARALTNTLRAVLAAAREGEQLLPLGGRKPIPMNGTQFIADAIKEVDGLAEQFTFMLNSRKIDKAS